MINPEPALAQPASAFTEALSSFLNDKPERIVLDEGVRSNPQLLAATEEDPLVQRFLCLAKRPAFLRPDPIFGPFHVVLDAQGRNEAAFRVYRTYAGDDMDLVLGLRKNAWPNGAPPLYSISTTDTRSSAVEWDTFADRVRGHQPSLVDRVKDGLAKAFCPT